jgi:hypothetical protein
LQTGTVSRRLGEPSVFSFLKLQITDDRQLELEETLDDEDLAREQTPDDLSNIGRAADVFDLFALHFRLAYPPAESCRRDQATDRNQS